MFVVAIKYDRPPVIVPVKGTLNADQFINIMKENFAHGVAGYRNEAVSIIMDNAPCHKAKKVRKCSFIFIIFIF